ncbi:MAG: GrpB family protein [Chitinophagales bacterium]
MNIILEEYTPSWASMFSDEKEKFLTLFNESAIIEHIGSTAVEGLIAKPVIDIMIGLENFAQANSTISLLQNLDYIYVSEYEKTMPYRRFFTKEKMGKRTHQIHMVAFASEFWKRHLAFRDYLRTHEDVRNEYAALKKKLTLENWIDGNAYADAKTEFIRRIEQIALSK